MKLNKDTGGRDEHAHLRSQYVRMGDEVTTSAKLREGELSSYDAIIDTREEDE